MEQTLTDFLCEIGISNDDARFFAEAEKELRESTAWEEFSRLLDSARASGFDWDTLAPALAKIADASGIHEYTVTILFFFLSAPGVRERYREANISDRVFVDTMRDLNYKLTECKLVYGIRGTFVGKWFCGFFNLTRFQFGRLQFEEKPFGYRRTVDGIELYEDTRVINVHIPRTGTPMDKESCDASYRMAREFFASLFPAGSPALFVCKSWLLDPLTEDLIRPGTNMARFRDEFRLIDAAEKPGNPDLWRLFDTMETDYSKLPEDTSVRRAYKRHLLAGGKTGYGYGLMILR